MKLRQARKIRKRNIAIQLNSFICDIPKPKHYARMRHQEKKASKVVHHHLKGRLAN